MKYLILILLLFGFLGVKSQQRFPTGFPTQLNTGWTKWGYVQGDSGVIVGNRDTSFRARYSGTLVFRPGDRKFYYFDSTTLTWNLLNSTAIDTTSLSNRINLKLNISDTTNKWWGIGKRWVDTLYRVNDSTVGYTINGSAYTFEIKGGTSGPGSGLTSVGISMPSAFSVSGSPLTSNGTINISGAGTTAQYIRGNGTLATTDTGMIPNFHLKVRSLFSGTSPITYNSTTGAIGITNANTSGTKGAASFTTSFSDNGSGTIDLADLVSAGACTNCDLTVDAKGRITAYSNGSGGGGGGISALSNTGSGFRWVAAPNGVIKTGFGSNTITIDSSSNSNALTFKADTSVLATQGDIAVKLENITGLISAGTNVSITGSGTSGSPYVINASGGGGGGGTVTQVNSGYGLLGGPITTTGTLRVDTSITGVATLYNVNNLGRTYPDQHRWGTIYEKSSWTTLGDFTPQGTSNVSLSNGYVNITAATEDYTPVVRILRSRPTGLAKWKMTMQYRVTAWSASTNWFGPILKSLVDHSGANFGYMAFTGVSSSGGGNSFILDEDGTILVNGGAGPTKSLNDLMEITFSRNDTTLEYTVRNVTTSSATQTVSYTFPQNHSVILPNVGTWGVMYNSTSAGNIRLEYLKIESDETMSPNVLCVGDSKTAIGFADVYAGRWPAQLNATYPTVTYSAGSAEYVEDALLKVSELTQANPEKVILGFIGENDIRDGIPFATVTNNMLRLYNAYAQGGTDVYWICLPEDSTAGGVGLSDLKQWVETTFPNNFINTWDSLSTNNILDGIYDSGDGVHLNQAGMDKIVQTIIASNKLTTISPYRRTPFNANDGIVKFDGDSLWFNYPITPKASSVLKMDGEYNFIPSYIHDDGTNVIVSTAVTPTVPIGAILMNIQGEVATYGNEGGVYIFDRTSSSDYTAMYRDAGRFRFINSGTDVATLNSEGKWTFGNPIDITGGYGTLRIKKDYSFMAGQSVRGFALNVDTTTYTATAATGFGNGAVVSILPATFNASGGAASYTHMSSLYIERAPIAGTDMTFDNPWALNINSGSVRMAGLDSAGSPANMLWVNPNTGRITKAAVPSGASYTFANGLTESSGTVTWGGSLNQTTSINGLGTYGINMGQTASKLTNFSVTVNNSGYVQLFGALQYAAQSINTTGSTDIYYITKLDPIASDQNFVLTTGSGKSIMLIDSNNSAFNWNFTGVTVKDENNNVVTTSNPGTIQYLYYVNGIWHITYAAIAKEVTTSAGTLTLLPHDRTYSFGGTTTTWTLPALTNTVGRRYLLKNKGSGNITLNSNAGGNDIYDTSATSSITIAPGAARIVENDGTHWIVQ